MSFADQRKADVAATIAANPVQVTISRKAKVPNGGGRKIENTTLGPFSIRIFNQKSKQIAVNVSNTTAGVMQKDQSYAFLAGAEVDIRCTPNITDEFTAYGQRFRVTNAIHRYFLGELTSIDGSLEAID